MSEPSQGPIVLGITGASGAVYAARLLQHLCDANLDVHVIISPSGATVLEQELGIPVRDGHVANIESLLKYHCELDAQRWPPIDRRGVRNVTVHHHQNFMSPVASGSFLTRGMVICPCSGATLSGVVHASSNNLIQRAAEVHLKEHRKLILVPRETPVSVFQLENMQRAAQAGAIVLPAMPGWYHGIRSVVDLIDFVVARILDHLGIENALIHRWGQSPPSTQTENAG